MRILRHYIYLLLPILVAVVFMIPADVMAMPTPDPAPRTTKSSSRKKTTTSSSRRKTTSSKKRTSSSRRRTTTRRATGSGAGVAPTFTQTETPGGVSSAAKPLTREQEQARKRRKITVEKPDMDLIKQMTLDPKSEFYFPKLMAKYNRNDTTMTQEEYRNLYLGYIFQEDYDPYRTSPYSGVTDALREKKTHTKEEIDTIKKYAELTLRDNPFDLRQMSFLVHVLKERRKDMSAKIWEYRLEHLLGAIKSTGTGENMENAFYVIYPMHEYDLIQLLGYEATDVDFIEPGYDYLTVRPSEEGAKRLRNNVQPGFYFNVGLLTEAYEDKHPEILEETTGTEGPTAVEIIEEPDPDDIPAE